MRLGEPTGQKSKQIVAGVIGFLALIFTVLFWNEILWLITGISPIQMINDPVSNLTISPGQFLFFIIIVSYFLVAALWIVLISFQALLPVTDLLQDPFQCLQDVYRTCWHLLLYMFRLHGPAIFVKNGLTNTTSEDLRRENWPGVVVIDFNSAVVLEERNPPPGMNGAFINIIMFLLEALGLCDRKESPRVRGAGITFTRPRERIRGTVDLRKHFRLQPQVRCYTREGIELYANIFSGFTIGQPPDVLQVTCIGDLCPENLYVVTTDTTDDGLIRVSKFSEDPDEIDMPDRDEIMQYLRAQRLPRNNQYMPDFFALPPASNRVQYDANRVFQAVFAQARNGNQESLLWTDLPTRVAAGFYRQILSQINYDDLYDIKNNGKFPLPDYKARLRFAMRSHSILSYRLLFTRDGRPLVKGRLYQPEELFVSAVIPLTNTKVLRDRGIKIFLSSFGDLTPVNEAIYKQRLDSWRAGWQRDLNISLATRDLEAERERGRARSEAQRDLWYSLSQLLERREFSEEALALRVLQALETAAADPRTRALLPEETINMLQTAQTFLLHPYGVPATHPSYLSEKQNEPGTKRV
jgi:hypothetical protein